LSAWNLLSGDLNKWLFFRFYFC